MKPGFRLVRYYSVASFITFAAAALVFGLLYREVAIRDVLYVTQQDNVARAQVLAKHFWANVEPLTHTVEGLEGEELRNHPNTGKILEFVIGDLNERFKGMRGDTKIKIFNPQGLTLFSTEEREIGEDKSASQGFNSALGGEIFSKLVHKDMFSAFEKKFEHIDLVETYIPIRHGGPETPVEAVFELYYDVSHIVRRMQRTQLLVILGVTATLMAVYGVLYFIVTRAERLIKRVERKLNDELVFLETLIETVPFPIFFKGPDGRYLGCNKAFEEFLGLPKEEITGRTVYDVAPEYLAKTSHEADQALFREGGVQFYESPVSHADGSSHDVIFNKAVFLKSDGSTGGLVGAMLDITERKRIEEELKISESRFRSIIENAQDAIVSIDRIGNVTQFNPAAERIFGYGREEAVGRCIGDLVVPDEMREQHNKGIMKFAETGEGPLIGKLVEVEAKRADGSTFPAELLLSKDTGKGGDICTAIVRDVTESKEIEQQLRQAQKVESLGTLAGGITHELNNLLLPIATLTRMALKKLPKNNSERGKLEKVVEASDRAKDVVAQVLAFSRMEAPQKENIEIANIILDALKLIRTTSPSTIKIEEKLDEDVSVVCADADQIKALLMSLTSNALDAMEGMTGEMKVSLSRAEVDKSLAGSVHGLEVGDYAKLTVSDSGHGMDEEVLERLFDPFYTTKDVGKGTGLGLSMVQGTLAKHNGAIGVTSEPGKGTTIEVYLPLVKDGE